MNAMSQKIFFRAEDWMVEFLDTEARKCCKGNRSDVIRFGLTYFMFAVRSGFFEGKDPMEMAKKIKDLIDETEEKTEDGKSE